MAGTNDPNEVAEALARVAEDMRRFGYITEDTAKKLEDAKTGISNFGKKADQAAELTIKAFTSVATAGTEAAKAMHDGAKGNQAFNSSLDKMREGVEATGALLTAIIPGGPIVKAFIAAATLATGKLMDMQKVAGKMSDDLFKGFQGLSKSGAAAADGMTGLQAGMRKLGLGVQDFEGYVRMIGESSKDLALFRGSVFAGRKAFEDIGQGMQQYNYQLRAAGLGQEEINAGTMSYLKLQTQVGRAQNMTTQQLADGAKKYLIEQDALTKLTGQSREEAEKAQEVGRSQQRFRAKLEEMRNTGDAEQIRRADELEVQYKMLYARSKEAAQGFGDMTTGMITTEASQKLLISSNGRALEVANGMVNGQMNAIQGFQEIGQAVGKGTKSFNMLYQTGVGEEFLLKISEGAELGLAANRNLTEEYKKIQEELARQGITGGKAADDLTDANIRLAQAQQQAMKDLQETTGKMMLDATNTSIALAKAGGKMDEAYEKLVPLMAKFSELLTKLVNKVLPPLIDGLIRLLNLIPGLGPDTAEAESERINTGAGVLGGAAVGAAIGSVVPVLGTAVGAAVGGALGGYAGNKFGRGTVLGSSEEMMSNAIPGMAAGGPVNPNTPYIVGEKGPELFMPKMAGEIISTKQLLGSGAPAGMPEVDAEYRRIVKAIKDITVATEAREKDTEAYTEHNKKYHLEMTSLFDQDYNNTKNYMEAGGTPAAMSAGLGLQPGGGLGMTMGGSLAGLKLKQGDVHAEGAALSPRLVQLAQAIQSNMPNFNYFSAFNDRYHQEKASSSSHTRGQALDFTLTKPPTPQEGQEIVRYLQRMGASLVIDEYNNPSSNATAGHIHAQIPGFADGGIALDPTIAMVAEKGPEAMVPLNNDGIFGKLSSAMSAMVPQQQTMIGLLEDIRRHQYTTASASERMATVAAN